MADSYDHMAGEEQDADTHPDNSHNFSQPHGIGDYFMAGAKDWVENNVNLVTGKGSNGYPVGPRTKELINQDAYRKVNKLDK